MCRAYAAYCFFGQYRALTRWAKFCRPQTLGRAGVVRLRLRIATTAVGCEMVNDSFDLKGS